MSIPLSRRTFYKDIQHLFRTIESSTDSQASIEGLDSTSVRIALRPQKGINAHAVFYMDITEGCAYPINPPNLHFASPIFHPNISPEGSICINILSEWKR
ncbi:hypothetical protein ACTXT7_010755 [Hymenolepis weldensis]